MKRNAFAASIALTAGLAFAGAVSAATFSFMIDDWNINDGTGNFVSAVGVGNSGGPAARTAAGGVSLPRGNIFTTVTAGGAAAANTLGDCSTCKFGTFSNDVGTRGWGYWSWTGGGDLSAFTDISFDYFADLVNADIAMAFFQGGALVASAQKSDMGGTGGLPVAFTLPIDMSAATAIEEVRLYVFSEGGLVDTAVAGDPLSLGVINAGAAQGIGLDFGVRALELTYQTPEPGTLALLGLGLAGLGALRRRRD